MLLHRGFSSNVDKQKKFLRKVGVVRTMRFGLIYALVRNRVERGGGGSYGEIVGYEMRAANEDIVPRESEACIKDFFSQGVNFSQACGKKAFRMLPVLSTKIVIFFLSGQIIEAGFFLKSWELKNHLTKNIK